MAVDIKTPKFYGLNDWEITAITYMPNGAVIYHYGGESDG